MPRRWRVAIVVLVAAWLAALITGVGGSWAHVLAILALAVFTIAPVSHHAPPD